MIKLSVTREPATKYIQPSVYIVRRLPERLRRKMQMRMILGKTMPGHTADHLCEKHAAMI